MVRIATFVLAASLAAAAQEKKPVEAPSLDTNVAPAQKGGPPAKADKAPAKKNGPKAAKKKGAGPPAPKPDPALTAAFKSAVGTWRCTGSMMLPADMGGQQMKTRSQMTIRREVGGFAYSGDYRMESNKAFPGFHARMLWTYDPLAKKFYELSADDAGGAVRGESDGMQDGKMVWSEVGAMMGKPAKSTTTVLSSGKGHMEVQFSMQASGGSSMTGAERSKKI